MSFPPSFEAGRLQVLGGIERGHFWFRGRRALVDQLLQRHAPPAGGLILDDGCGTGWMSRWLEGRGYRVLSIDGLREGGPTLQAAAEHLPLPGGSLQGVLALDLFEHTADALALAEIRRVLAPGGWLLLSVPALQFLWSYRDVAAGHRRRYGRRQLHDLLSASGFRVEVCRFYQFLLFPVVVMTRWLGRRGPRLRDHEDNPPACLNAFFSAVCRFEVKMGNFLPIPIGTSLVVFCRKI